MPLTDEVAANTSTAKSLASFDRRVLIVATAALALMLALSGLYGYDRDELYFLDAARHLQGGYVDQPILAPLLVRVSLSLFGVSLPGLRIWPSMALAATVIVGALLAREFGGGRRAQLLAAIGTATMPVALGADHLEGPTSIDILVWAALSLVVARIGRSGNLRGWMLAGLVLGVGLTNKHSIGFFALAILCGVILSGAWRLVLNRWLLFGALIAGVFAVPDLVWQALHGWPTIAMTKSLNAENGGPGNIGNWLLGQLIMVSLALVWVWMAGIGYLWRSGKPMWRALVWAYGLLFVFFALTTGAKIYYLGGAYVYLLAAGSVRLEGWLAARPARSIRLYALTALTTVAALPLVLPVLPAKDIGWTYKINQVPAESVGWPELVHTVSTVWNSLSLTQRSNAVIFTADYGEVGAINELGRGMGLPTAVSGQNNEWFWGPGNPTATMVVVVAPGPKDVTGYGAYLSQFFEHVRVAATLSNDAGLQNQESGGHVYVCTDPRHQWGAMWPKLRHYD